MKAGPAKAGVFLVLLLLCSAAVAEDLCLSTVIANVAVEPPASVRFIEQRHSTLLKEPLQLTGQLEYLARGTLRKTIETPFAETLLVDQRQIEVSREGRTQRLSLKSNRMMQTLLGGIEALLAGDTAHLEKQFETSLVGCEANWVLQLRPRITRIAEHLQMIEVQGGGESIHSIRIQFNAQEWQLMELEAALPAETP